MLSGAGGEEEEGAADLDKSCSDAVLQREQFAEDAKWPEPPRGLTGSAAGHADPRSVTAAADTPTLGTDSVLLTGTHRFISPATKTEQILKCRHEGNYIHCT